MMNAADDFEIIDYKTLYSYLVDKYIMDYDSEETNEFTENCLKDMYPILDLKVDNDNRKIYVLNADVLRGELFTWDAEECIYKIM